MRVLLIEEDTSFGNEIVRIMKNADYVVDWVRDANAGKRAIDTGNHAVVLLALRANSVGDIDLIRGSRTAGSDVPILMLAACDDMDLCIQCLDSGADDCLSSPLYADELLARIRAALRRNATCATSRLGDETISLDIDRRTLWCNGVETLLSAREFALMHALLERRGAILSRAQIAERLYGRGRDVESNSVEVLIHGTRKKFGQSLIRNVRGLGWTIQPAEGGIFCKR
jgi:two-component system, OmpR family, response regulator